MSLRIRRATADDLEVVAELFDGYRQFYGQASDVEAARDFIESRLNADESVILLADATVDETTANDKPSRQAIGFTQLYPMFSSVRMGSIWILNDLFVAEDHRQRGAGRALMIAAQTFAEDQGAIGLQLETQRTNTVAQSLYTNLGWEAADDTVWFSLSIDGSESQRQRDDAPFDSH